MGNYGVRLYKYLTVWKKLPLKTPIKIFSKGITLILHEIKDDKPIFKVLNNGFVDKMFPTMKDFGRITIKEIKKTRKYVWFTIESQKFYPCPWVRTRVTVKPEGWTRPEEAGEDAK